MGYFDASITVNGKQYFGWVRPPFGRYLELFTTVENRKRDYPYPYVSSTFYGKGGSVLTDGSIITANANTSIAWRFYYTMTILVS